MLIAGGFIAVLGVISEYWFLKDYWHPAYILKFGELGGIEDILFGFAAGSLASVAYDLLFKSKTYIKIYPKRIWIYPYATAMMFIGFILFSEILKLNSIFATSIIGFVIAGTIIVIRSDLLKMSIISALVFGLLYTFGLGIMLTFFTDYLAKYYILHGNAPVLFGIFPMTEFLWGLACGAVVGVLSPFAEGKGFVIKEDK
jgi:hypothetical protein